MSSGTRPVQPQVTSEAEIQAVIEKFGGSKAGSSAARVSDVASSRSAASAPAPAPTISGAAPVKGIDLTK